QVDWQYGNYPEAIGNALNALRMREAYGDSAVIARSYFQMGILRAELAEYAEAQSWYERALRIARARSDKKLTADVLHFIGRAWRKQEIYDKALKAHEESKLLYEQLNDEAGLADYYNNVGSVYRRQGKYSQALRNFALAQKIQQKQNDLEGLADTYNDIGTTLTQQRRYSEAIEYLERALAIAQQTGLRDDVRYAYSSLSAAYDSMGDYRNAYFYYRKFNLVRDSLVNQQKNDLLTRMTLVYGSQAQQREIDTLKAQARARQNYYVLILYILGSIAAAILAFMVFLGWRSRNQMRVNRQLAAKNREIEAERKKSDELLLNILPEQTAAELKSSPDARVATRSYEEVSVMFIDFHGFTLLAAHLSPVELVNELHYCFSNFDTIIDKYNIEKIKTIGDAYMCAGGLPETNKSHAHDVIRAGLEIQKFMRALRDRRQQAGLPYFEARIGIHTGPLVAGVVGKKKFAYDIWGDTVNTASRIETCGEVGKVNISKDTYDLVKDTFICRSRGMIHAKNKGEIEMFFVEWGV
ncbi:MAG: hypothetical protein EAZ89_11430, partial [Bacteroidetes bacterium]